MKHIFIGGTGRSGTTILAKFLEQHPEIYKTPKELRFITDPDGLIDLKRNFTDNWSQYNVDFAVDRFIKLLKRIFYKKFGTYPLFGLSELTNFKNVDIWINNYLNKLNVITYKGAWYGRRNIVNLLLLRLLGKNTLTSYFINNNYYAPPHNEDDFCKITREFLDDFFSEITTYSNKNCIVDHTPTNILHAHELIKIFPDAKIIHIKRDPRDVIASYTRQSWGSSNTIENLEFVKGIYDRWNKVKQYLPEKNLMEFKFEDFIYENNKILSDIEKFIGFENLKNSDIRLDKHNIGQWQYLFNDELKKNIKIRYGEFIKKIGYTI